MHKRSRWRIPVTLLLLGVAAFAFAVWLRAPKAAQAVASRPASAPEKTGVGCLGHIEAGDGVIRVAGPYHQGRPSVVRELRVKEGDALRAGQIIAILDGDDELQAAVQQSEARVAVARRRLDQVQAGPKSSDLDAQKAEIGRLEALLENARSTAARYKLLRDRDEISAVDFDARQTAVTTAERALSEARHRLLSIAEVRPTDITLAQAELDAALADEHRARTDADTMIVRSPVSGRLVKVHAHTSEEAGPDGIVDIAETRRMYAIAEVYETDIQRVRIGQQAFVSGGPLSKPVLGKVERIGLEVDKNQVMTSDPVAFSDARIVPVHIRLADPGAVSGLIHARVSVRIEP
jgi:HlyD family secretion protein